VHNIKPQYNNYYIHTIKEMHSRDALLQLISVFFIDLIWSLLWMKICNLVHQGFFQGGVGGGGGEHLPPLEFGLPPLEFGLPP